MLVLKLVKISLSQYRFNSNNIFTHGSSLFYLKIIIYLLNINSLIFEKHYISYIKIIK